MATSWVEKSGISEFVTKRIRLFVTNNHRDYPGEWVWTCPELNVKANILVSGGKTPSTLDEAQRWATSFAKQRLNAMLKDLS
jgi:hypothetical protein